MQADLQQYRFQIWWPTRRLLSARARAQYFRFHFEEAVLRACACACAARMRMCGGQAVQPMEP